MPKRTSRDTSYKIIVAGVDRIHRQLKPPGTVDFWNRTLPC